jgi:hypothetical protein
MNLYRAETPQDARIYPEVRWFASKADASRWLWQEYGVGRLDTGHRVRRVVFDPRKAGLVELLNREAVTPTE